MLERADRVLDRLERLLERLDRSLEPAPIPHPWDQSTAFRWLGSDKPCPIKPVLHPHRIGLADLRCVNRQKDLLERNTCQFLQGLPANNALLWGSRGTGKSSLIKALLTDYASQGLRLIEVDKHHLIELPAIVDLVHERPERFILYSDDLSFEAEDPSYKALKAILDGSITAPGANVLIYATSNRRHLMPEFMAENLETRQRDGEIHPGEAIEEKVSLSERFGIWVSFYPFTQDEYLAIVDHWLRHLDVLPADWTAVRNEALQWALQRGSRSGRVAWQFARDWAGRSLLDSSSAAPGSASPRDSTA
jgi:hypothetical protein